MRLHRLLVRHFAAIPDVDLAFGPGLNVLYGPNDIGKSTLADAIRLALLLPHTSTACEPYIPWSGGEDPLVELTFETEPQRIWRVRKQFGKRGSSLLQVSRNGVDFEDVERARKVDAKLRDILRWGIPEPGGSGAGKGLPTSFLATALLSTQANVTDVLNRSLRDDGTLSGKSQIAAALEAVAQDSLFLALLRQAQARRDEAFTDKGAKKTARGSVFKIAADRVKEAREEKERLEKIVEESDEVEAHLKDLYQKRTHAEGELAAAEERLVAVQLLAGQVIAREVAGEAVESARAEVARIQGIDQAVAEAEQRVRDLAAAKEQAEQNLKAGKAAAASAGDALVSAEEQASATGSDMAETVARQGLELQKLAAEQAVEAARRRVEAAIRVQEKVQAADRVEEEHRQKEAEAASARERRAEATQAETSANDALRRCEVLERGAEARIAERTVASARAEVERESALHADSKRIAAERADLAERRTALVVPGAAILPALRKLETELATARGALEVGFVMTVIPTSLVALQVRKDGVAVVPTTIARPLVIEADAEAEVDIADLATVRVRGGRREAQDRARALESRRAAEVLPHLVAAGVEDLEGLEEKMTEAKELDSRLQSIDVELESLGRQLAGFSGAAETLREASERSAACRLALEDETVETLASDLDLLGPDPSASLRARRQQATRDAEAARAAVQESATAQALAEERTRALRSTLEAARADRDAALLAFPCGLASEIAAAEASLRAAEEDRERVATELRSLQSRMAARKSEIDSVLAQVRDAVDEAQRGVETAQESLSKAIADHSNEEGRLVERRRQRAAEDLPTAECALRETTDRHDALPVPERMISAEEVTLATEVSAKARQALASLTEEILTTQGRLQQVGGAIAKDRLRQAVEAFELAEQQDYEIETDYEAWKLLLEQMKEADADQASNLGQALAPAIAGRFEALTRQRYQNVHLSADLSTEGVFVAGEVRSPDRMSVGTREQLSTLYRLCLGEYLQTTVVLDDQLVQSDDVRMEWFRGLLAEKARIFQILVFTCRPGDYLTEGARVGEDGMVCVDGDEGFVRAIDLGRALSGNSAHPKVSE